MPWTVKNPPGPAKNWPEGKKRACVLAANAALRAGKSDKEAIQACIGAANNVDSNSLDHGAGQMQGQRVVDLFMADRVLTGEPVRLLPLMETGYWRGGALRPPITPEQATVIVANFQKRAVAGVYQANLPLNIEHDDLGGKIGTIKDLSVGDDGVYAVFELTEKGRSLLADGAFDYLSPEIVWDLEDTRTGEPIGPFIVGAAVTNYPFFGEATAMFSREAGERLEAAGLLSDQDGLSENGLFELIRRAVQSVFGERSETEVEEMSEPQNGVVLDTQLQIPEEFTRQLEEQRQQIEEFQSLLRQQQEAMTSQAQTIEAQRGQIVSLNDARLRERFSAQVAGLSHVGAENEQLVSELMWLHERDDTDDRGHFSYWSSLLSTVEQAMADSVAFQEVGRVGHTQVAGAVYSRFQALVAETASQRNLVVSEGDANWARIAQEVASEHPELYNQYIQQVRQQGNRR